MARISGKSGQVWLKEGTPTEDDALLGVQSWEVDGAAEPVEVTGMDSVGFKEFIGGLLEGTGTVELWADGELPSDIRSGKLVGCRLLYQDGDENAWQGTALVQSLKPTVAVDGAVKWSISLTFSEGLSYEPI